MAARTGTYYSRPRHRITLRRVLIWVVLVVTTIVSLWPMYWLFVTALTPTSFTIDPTPDIIPARASFSNFARLFEHAKDYWRWAFNSLVVALTVTVWHIVFDTMAGYAFAKKRFPGRTVLFWVILSTLMIPEHVTLVPLYIVTRKLGMLDSIWAVILPGTAYVFGIFLMRQYIQTLPSELIDAARVDGASELGVFFRVIMPLCKPAIAALAIFTFVRFWNAFLWPLVVLHKSENFTLPVGVYTLSKGEFTTDFGIVFAGAALAALPMILFFLAFQRYFLEGVRMGAIKG